ncbi:hypothetical protein KAF44_19150 [Cupriavidus necator]|nr:hypothetical protein KAF44_19150 [Cupriavidus necator]
MGRCMLLTKEMWLDRASGQDPVPPYLPWRVVAAVPVNPLLVLQLYPASLEPLELITTYVIASFESLLETWDSLLPEHRVGATVHLIRGGITERVREIWQYKSNDAAVRRFAFRNDRGELIPYWGDLPTLADKQCLAVIE